MTKKEWSQSYNGVGFEDRERGPWAKKMWVNSGSQRRQENGFSPIASREALVTVSDLSPTKVWDGKFVLLSSNCVIIWILMHAN